MGNSNSKKTAHRNAERHHCPPFFEARICCAAAVEERAKVENVSVRGLSARTCCEFVPGSEVDIELKSGYGAPVRLSAQVRWVKALSETDSIRLIGFSIRRIGVIEWFRYMRLLSQLKKELW